VFDNLVLVNLLVEELNPLESTPDTLLANRPSSSMVGSPHRSIRMSLLMYPMQRAGGVLRSPLLRRDVRGDGGFGFVLRSHDGDIDPIRPKLARQHSVVITLFNEIDARVSGMMMPPTLRMMNMATPIPS